MTDRPRTDQEQWVADLFRLLGFDVKMNYWPRETPSGIEIDVWGRLGPLQVAVECKKYSRDAVGSPDIEYFQEKLQMLGRTLGIFVANSYSDRDLKLCRRFGIVPLTSDIVLEQIDRFEQEAASKKHLAISTRAWEVMGALMRFALDWRSYFDPSWPFHREIYATEAFEAQGLIQTQRDNQGDFEYSHTEGGKSFFGHLKYLLQILEAEGVTPMQRVETAGKLVVGICTVDPSVPSFEGYNRLVVQGLDLQDANGQPTVFGRQLALVIQEAVPGAIF